MAGLGNRAGEKGKGNYGGAGDPAIIFEADLRREGLS